jgi:hypothetical protein
MCARYLPRDDHVQSVHHIIFMHCPKYEQQMVAHIRDPVSEGLQTILTHGASAQAAVRSLVVYLPWDS